MQMPIIQATLMMFSSLPVSAAVAAASDVPADVAKPLARVEIDDSLSEFSTADRDAVRIEVATGQVEPVPLATFSVDEMTSSAFAVRLVVDYAVPGQPAYFEMWTVLKDGRRYFSRTLAKFGPSKQLAGREQNQVIVIPMSLSGSSQRVDHVELSLVMPGGGQVTIHDATAYDLVGGLSATNVLAGGARAWVPPWFGGVLGSIFGIVAGCLGSLYVYSYRSGWAFSFMQHFPVALGIVGGLLLLVGAAALVAKQPYHVWYPFVLMGILGVIAAPLLRRQTMSQYPKEVESFENRQMRAMDA